MEYPFAGAMLSLSIGEVKTLRGRKRARGLGA
jgi:hypothetical protein